MIDEMVKRYSQAMGRYLSEAIALEEGRGSRGALNEARTAFEAVKTEIEAGEPTMRQLLDAFGLQARASDVECRMALTEIFTRRHKEPATE